MAANTRNQDLEAETDEGRGDQSPCARCDQEIIWVGRAVAPGGYSHTNVEQNGDHRAEYRG